MNTHDLDLLELETQQHLDEGVFPLIVNGEHLVAADDEGEPDAAADAARVAARVAKWVEPRRAELDRLLSRHGAVLFRGFPLVTVEDFDAFILAFDYPNFRYRDSLSNAVRVNRTERVFTANEAPPDVEIYMHHEMAQTPVYPSRLFFFCELPADEAGATPVCRSDLLWQRIKDELPEFAAAAEARGLLYTNVMPDSDDAGSGQGRSWRSTFFADTREEAEARMTTLGYSWEWMPDGSLRATTPTLPAVRTLDDGRQVFFNQLIAGFRGWKDARNDPSKAITFGDAAPLDRDAVHRLCDIADELTFDIPWRQGDVVLVDNYLVMHGRRPYRGKRKVLASLVAA